MVIFKDRESAGKLLAKRLANLKDKKDAILLAIPRGGVVVASEVARELRLPLDIVITRKIGAPNQPELALGAVDPNGEVVWDENLVSDLGLSKDELREDVEKEKKEIKRRERIYRGEKEPLQLVGKTVILVDDGIATGATILTALRYLKSLGVKRSVIAVPVVAEEILNKISQETDEIIALHSPEFLGAVGSFYQDFTPVEDQEVIELLKGVED